MHSLPLIIGHRGASAVAPENTLAAFEQAMADGADGIEFDVRLARDGVPVVIHDATLERTGLIGGRVADLSSTELQQTDVGSWFSRRSRASGSEFRGENLPSLTQVFDLFSRNTGLLYLEMKSETSDVRLASEVVRAIHEYSLRARVIVESFDLSLIREVKRIDSEIRTAALFEPKVSRPLSLIPSMKLVTLASDCRADEIALHYSLASRHIIEKAKHSGLRVVVWTVDNPNWIERARFLGIAALITNNPAAMIRARV
ncbi:MAG: glycerophosphodiester phosphodiesterase [Pyrinomonadaceae bacterium]